MHAARLLALLVWLGWSSDAKPPTFVVEGVADAAARYGRDAKPPVLQPDRPLVIEAEEFLSADHTWQPREYGTNYYVSTFANTFLSRWAYLHAAAGHTGSAERKIRVKRPGQFLLLVRYEAVYRFHTPFEVRVLQAGKEVFRRVYGRKDRPRIWAFRHGLADDVAWPWGANEQIVWEGHDAVVRLDAGEAVIQLVASAEPQPQADRHVDCILLTADRSDVERRIQSARYLPLDGLLTQAGDLWCRVSNHSVGALQVTLPPCIEHSPYWVHPRTWKARQFGLDSGQQSDWVEVGSLLDSLNHSVWIPRFRAINGPRDYQLQLAVRAPSGKLQVVFDERANHEQLRLYMSPAFRYVPLVYSTDQALPQLLRYLEERARREPLPPGRLSRYVVYATSFTRLAHRPAYNKLVDRWWKLFPLVLPGAESRFGYVDVRHLPTERLAAFCKELAKKGIADRIRVVSLGDEISLPSPTGDQTDAFRRWLQQQGVRPRDVVPGASEWGQVNYLPPPDPKREPRRYFYVQRFRQRYGIEAIKRRTDILRNHLPNALIGANYSPHQGAHYLGEVYKWVEVFQDEGMTLPWSEDYIWQIPVASPQVAELSLAMFRAAVRDKPIRQIHYYVMPHWPGNHPRMWRRLFYAALGHGMTIANLFEFRPLPVAYTENYVNLPETYWQVLRACRELARFEDLVLDGQPVPGEVGLWFSTAADIWRDHSPPYAAEKRSLYVVLRHLQVPVEVVTDLDVKARRLDRYRILFLTDRHVARSVAEELLRWVRHGGVLVLTAAAATRDEFDQPLDLLYRPVGPAPAARVDEAVPIRFVKQDLAWARPMGQVSAGSAEFPVFGAIAPVSEGKQAETVARFADGSPAVRRVRVGAGQIWYFGFLPGLAAVHPSVAREPVTRGGDEQSLSHRMPTRFEAGTLDLLSAVLEGYLPPVEARPRTVETCLIRAKAGSVLIAVAWQQSPCEARVVVRVPVPRGRVETASGRPVRVRRLADGALQLEWQLDAADAVIFRQ